MSSPRLLPTARTEDLIVEVAGNETLVYDERNHEAHCLNRTAGLVWRHCDGRTTVTRMAEILGSELGLPADPDVVDFALEQLANAELLAERPTLPFGRPAVSRRHLLGKLGAAMVLAPLVTSILTRTARAQASPPRVTTTRRPGGNTGGSTTRQPTTTTTTTTTTTQQPTTTTTTTTTTLGN